MKRAFSTFAGTTARVIFPPIGIGCFVSADSVHVIACANRLGGLELEHRICRRIPG